MKSFTFGAAFKRLLTSLDFNVDASEMADMMVAVRGEHDGCDAVTATSTYARHDPSDRADQGP